MLRYVSTARLDRFSKFFQAGIFNRPGDKMSEGNPEEFLFYVDFVFV